MILRLLTGRGAFAAIASDPSTVWNFSTLAPTGLVCSKRIMGNDHDVLALLTPEQRSVLVGLQLLSHGATASLSPIAGRGGEGAQVSPAGEGHPPHDRIIEQLRRPGADRDAIMADAADELDAWKRRPLAPPPVVESLDDIKDRITECHGWSTADVSRAMRCTESLVKVARVERGCDPTWGHPLPAPLPVEPRARAAALVDLGLPYRQVQALCGVPITTIYREKAKRAAA